jgi:hypothetical protein
MPFRASLQMFSSLLTTEDLANKPDLHSTALLLQRTHWGLRDSTNPGQGRQLLRLDVDLGLPKASPIQSTQV